MYYMIVSLFYAKPEYSLFQRLVRTHSPHARGFVPEYDAYEGAKEDAEKGIPR